MQRSQRTLSQSKKVLPPVLPGDQPLNTQQPSLYSLEGFIGNGGTKHPEDAVIMSGVVASPSLEEGGFNLPRETSVALRNKAAELKDKTRVVGPNKTTTADVNLLPATSNHSLLGACAPVMVQCPPSVFCSALREPLTHKAAVYYHQQLALQEDQGIDLTQSPGRDSPGSSSGSACSGSRHSTASLDSGRASSYLTGASTASFRGSAGGALSSPRCSSLSSCSIGSVDRQRNEELIIEWLIEIKYEEYAQQFIAAGYDLPTIARMTPEDLTAIGIKNPHHREYLKHRIDTLQVFDNLPNFVPGSIEEWLQLLRLEDYIQPLLDQNYKTVRDVTQVTWEDLEDIGIVKLGHQKKILLAIKRVKDIINGKWHPSAAKVFQPTQTWRRSYDDGDITPTNDIGRDTLQKEGGGTLPRQQRGMLQRVMVNSLPSFERHLYINTSAANCGYHSDVIIGSDLSDVGGCPIISDTLLVGGMDLSTTYRTEKPVAPQKIAPDPPRRHCSVSSSRKIGPIDGGNQHSHGVPHAQSEYCSMMTGAALNQYHSISWYSKPSQIHQPIYANYAAIQKTTAEIHTEHLQNNQSNSSIDSIDTIPFANENTGTIKQRLLCRHETNSNYPQVVQNQQPTSHSHSLSSSPSPLMNTEGNIAHPFLQVESATLLHKEALVTRSESMGCNARGCSEGASSCSNNILLRSPSLSTEIGVTRCSINRLGISPAQSAEHEAINDSASIKYEVNSDQKVAPPNTSEISVNVLNDIGNMLANLTDELDAMLEEEKRAGLNVDSE